MYFTFLYKAYWKIDSDVVKSNAVVSTKTNLQRCVQRKLIERRLFTLTNVESNFYYKNNKTLHLEVSVAASR